MHSEKLNAFVLSTLDYGDSDRIVNLFTLEYGRLKAFARGARKSRKRFGAALELFAHIDAQLKVKEGLCSFQQAEIRQIYPAIRKELEKIAHAMYASELLDALTPEGLALPRLFRLFSAYLDRLEAVPPTSMERRFFEINLLNILGYRPALEECGNCASIYGESGAIVRLDGELVCSACSVSGPQLQPATLQTLQACLKTGIFGLVRFSDAALAEAGILLDASLEAHAGRRIKSADFLIQLLPGQDQ